MTVLSDFMSAHHRDCDELQAAAEVAVAAGSWEDAAKQGARFRDETLRHFRMEEEVLFPALERATGMSGGPTDVMRREHAQARELLATLDAALDARDAAAWLSAGETLLLLIQQHDMKEEGILYPMADRAVGHEAEELLRRMSDVGSGS